MCWALFPLIFPAGSFPGPGETACADSILQYSRGNPADLRSLFSSLLGHSVMQTLAALLSLDFSSISSGQGIHQILLSPPSVLCSLGHSGAHHLICFCLSGTTVSLLADDQCLEKHCFKCFVLLFGGFGWEPVPVIPSWLEAESLVCIFLPSGTFPVLNCVENSTV